MANIYIIHFSPLELYPPIQNLLCELEKASPSCRIFVITSQHHHKSLARIESTSEKIKIIRVGKFDPQLKKNIRYWNYFKFYLCSLYFLFKDRPAKVLYFETLSSFPVYIYKRFVSPGAQVFIHYHEYSTPQQYATGMYLERFFHKQEHYLYPNAIWVSHTNEMRMEKFKADIFPVTFENAYILPNYPPPSWMSESKSSYELPLKIVYVGALSLDTMYTKEFSDWVMQQEGNVLWDIYSYNYSPSAKKYLQTLDTPWITLYEGVNYNELPDVLRKYDIGLILYNGHIPNYVYNAPNKLFEYLAVGLSVWFPDVMIGSLPYCTKETYPEVIALDFNQLALLKLDSVVNRNKYTLKESPFFCSAVLTPLIDKLISDGK